MANTAFDPDDLISGKALLNEDQRRMAADVLQRVALEELETIRISFADQHGILRGKTIIADGLASAFRNGMAMVSSLLLKDTSHRTVFPVWQSDIGLGRGTLTGAGDFLIVPDPATFRVLPWSPKTGWLLCDARYKDGSAMPFCTRSILRGAEQRLAAQGMAMLCGLEHEFYVFRVTDQKLAHGDAGMPGAVPETGLIAQGYQYLTENRYDTLEPVMDLLRINGQQLGLPIRSLEAEFGPSQCEITFEPGAPLQQADDTVLFRSMVKQVCARNGLHATFMCRPRLDHILPSGWHMHQSLQDSATGQNLMMPDAPDTLPKTAERWLAGLLDHAAESCLLSTPTVNGYKRYQPFQMAPDRIQWGRDNKGAMIRDLTAPGDKASRLENRVAEPTANPYLFIASQILCGLDGLKRGLSAPAPVENPYESDAEKLPQNLGDAIKRFETSGFYREALGDGFVTYLARIKQAEWHRYLATVSDWEQREYFALF